MNYYVPYQWRRRGGTLIRALQNGPLSKREWRGQWTIITHTLVMMRNVFDYYLHTVEEVDEHNPTTLLLHNQQRQPPPLNHFIFAVPNEIFAYRAVNLIITFDITSSRMHIDHCYRTSTSHTCPMTLSSYVQIVTWIVNDQQNVGWRIWSTNCEWKSREGRTRIMIRMAGYYYHT